MRKLELGELNWLASSHITPLLWGQDGNAGWLVSNASLWGCFAKAKTIVFSSTIVTCSSPWLFTRLFHPLLWLLISRCFCWLFFLLLTQDCLQGPALVLLSLPPEELWSLPCEFSFQVYVYTFRHLFPFAWWTLSPRHLAGTWAPVFPESNISSFCLQSGSSPCFLFLRTLPPQLCIP